LKLRHKIGFRLVLREARRQQQRQSLRLKACIAIPSEMYRFVMSGVSFAQFEFSSG
jgi:hypothetical protein